MNDAEKQVRRHATGATDRVTLRSYFAGQRLWYAPWLRNRRMSFTVATRTPAECERLFRNMAQELRRDALRPGFLDGFVEWVTVRDHWTGADDEDLRWIWRTCTPVEVRRLTIGADLTAVDTGAIAREAL